MQKLESLNFEDLEEVLDWFKLFGEAAGRIDVTYDKENVIRAFTEKGFGIAVNAKSDFDKDDARKYAGYIIGQALDSIRKAVDPNLLRRLSEYTGEWKNQFGKKNKTRSK